MMHLIQDLALTIALFVFLYNLVIHYYRSPAETLIQRGLSLAGKIRTFRRNSTWKEFLDEILLALGPVETILARYRVAYQDRSGRLSHFSPREIEKQVDSASIEYLTCRDPALLALLDEKLSTSLDTLATIRRLESEKNLVIHLLSALVLKLENFHARLVAAEKGVPLPESTGVPELEQEVHALEVIMAAILPELRGKHE